MIDLQKLPDNLNKYASMVGKVQDLANNNEDRIVIYESLIAGSILLRAKERSSDLDINNVIPTIRAMLEWLRTTDFYASPASTKYHESFHGGLLLHTLKAYNKMVEIHGLPSFTKSSIGSATLIILAHDWCKIGKYESYLKRELNKQTNIWEEKVAYKYSDKYVGLGHGPQSLIMLCQLCTSPLTNLTFDEMAAIRWHMYTYDVTSYDVGDLNHCNTKIPLVLLTQFADQLSVTEY